MRGAPDWISRDPEFGSEPDENKNSDEVVNEQNEVIPRRDIRAVEAIARSGRKLSPLTKPGNYS